MMNNLSDLEAALIELQIVSRIYAIPNTRDVLDFLVFCVTRNPKAKDLWVGVRKVFENCDIDYLHIQNIQEFVDTF